jgi:signal transduction histidine kinase
VLAAWPAVLALGFLAMVDAFDSSAVLAVVAWMAGSSLAVATIVLGLHDLRAADARSAAVPERAIAAETAERMLLGSDRVQQQLIRVTKLGAIGELAAAVAHEVNNPLTGIMGFSELLMTELPVGDARHTEAAIINAEAVRARAIIRSLLEFARPQPPQRVSTDLNGLARSTVELVRFRASEASVNISEDYADLPSLEIDPDAFRQVMLNLLNNALDAMRRGGELHVTTRSVGDRIGLVVADTGVGMDAATRIHIFEPFFSTRAGRDGGTGLGLAVSLQTVEGHGGSIEVVSEPGRGAVFTVWLPTASQEADDPVVRRRGAAA